MDIYSEKEKGLIRKAMMSTKPGPTDESRMRTILGNKLFTEMQIMEFKEKDLAKIDKNFFDKNKFSNTRFFIMHSKNDSIVPFMEGKSLSESLNRKGASVNFIGTELFSHTENKTTVSGLYYELKYMINFFDALFEGDVE